MELISGLQTAPETLERARAFAVACGKTVTESKDVPGFVSNALLMPFINEVFVVSVSVVLVVLIVVPQAIMHLEKGIATRDDIDTTLKLGMAHPMGPLQLADLYVLCIVYTARSAHATSASASILALQFKGRYTRARATPSTVHQYSSSVWSMQAGTGRRTERGSMNTQHDGANVQCMSLDTAMNTRIVGVTKAGGYLREKVTVDDR